MPSVILNNNQVSEVTAATHLEKQLLHVIHTLVDWVVPPVHKQYAAMQRQ